MIPLLIAAGIGSTLFGVNRGMKASDNNYKARHLISESEDIYNRAKSNYYSQKRNMEEAFEDLGTKKLRAYNDCAEYFFALFDTFKNVTVESEIKMDGIPLLDFSNPRDYEFARLESMNATELVGAGLGSIGAGVLAGFGSYSATMMFGTASTGTAIASLSGAAAKNAALASLGGGSIAAGGLGVAGGAVALGAISLGPAIAMAGAVAAAKSEENLAKASSAYSSAKYSAEQLNTAADFMANSAEIAEDFSLFITYYTYIYMPILRKLHQIQEKAREEQFSGLMPKIMNILRIEQKLDYEKLDIEDKKVMHLAMLMTQVLVGFLRRGILDENGELCEGADSIINDGEVAIEQLGIINEDAWNSEEEFTDEHNELKPEIAAIIIADDNAEGIEKKYCLDTVLDSRGQSAKEKIQKKIEKTKKIAEENEKRAKGENKAKDDNKAKSDNKADEEKNSSPLVTILGIAYLIFSFFVLKNVYMVSPEKKLYTVLMFIMLAYAGVQCYGIINKDAWGFRSDNAIKKFIAMLCYIAFAGYIIYLYQIKHYDIKYVFEVFILIAYPLSILDGISEKKALGFRSGSTVKKYLLLFITYLLCLWVIIYILPQSRGLIPN